MEIVPLKINANQNKFCAGAGDADGTFNTKEPLWSQSFSRSTCVCALHQTATWKGIKYLRCWTGWHYQVAPRFHGAFAPDKLQRARRWRVLGEIYGKITITPVHWMRLITLGGCIKPSTAAHKTHTRSGISTSQVKVGKFHQLKIRRRDFVNDLYFVFLRRWKVSTLWTWVGRAAQ